MREGEKETGHRSSTPAGGAMAGEEQSSPELIYSRFRALGIERSSPIGGGAYYESA